MQFPPLSSVVSKKVTTESTKKKIYRSILMRFPLRALRGFKKSNHGEHKEKYL
jgi:hypothetical protein